MCVHAKASGAIRCNKLCFICFIIAVVVRKYLYD